MSWGYPQHQWAQPARGHKRTHSESDDDVFSEESSKEQCTSPGDADSCQMMSRKKRRGVIEKKRRDRINNSLTELKRLVPTALEKQGSAKLEKAEILQLTVEHLKLLHSKGLDTLPYDPQRYAMDYHNIGFRECASEVARYLVSCEGLDIQDPMRLRLMSHLQCFAAQRELASKSCSTPYPPPPSYPPPPPTYPQVGPTQPHGYSHTHTHAHAPLPTTHPSLHEHHGYTETSVSSASVPPAPLPVMSSSSYVTSPHVPTSYHHPMPSSAPPTHHQYSQSGSKPYRPWGAEVAY